MRFCAKFESLLAASLREHLILLFGAEQRAGQLRDDDCAIVRISIERRVPSGV
ncbi:MAG: hypothetical protein WKF30_04900 [Pyrinomonadaceae bacterium]